MTQSRSPKVYFPPTVCHPEVLYGLAGEPYSYDTVEHLPDECTVRDQGFTERKAEAKASPVPEYRNRAVVHLCHDGRVAAFDMMEGSGSTLGRGRSHQLWLRSAAYTRSRRWRTTARLAMHWARGHGSLTPVRLTPS